jgi:PAS domain S-box-containing protein
MSQAKGHACLLSPSNSTPSNNALEVSAAARHSSVLVLADNRLVGIFTERDLVKLTASQTDLQQVAVGDVMTREPTTLELSENHTVMTALGMFQQHQIRHLPILDDRQQLIGVVTPEHIRQVLQPVNLLKFKSVSEGMTREVIHALPTATVLEIARMMNDRNIGSIVIVDGQEQPKPVGIVTERDIVQFQAFGLDLAQLQAQAVMSSPLFCLQSTDSLWAAQQVMQTKHIRRLVITNDRGELDGILTQSNLLQLLDPLEMLSMVDSLQSQLLDRTTELEAEIARREQVEAELRRAAQLLEERVMARTAELTQLAEELQVKVAEQEASDLALEISQQGISDFIENAPIGMQWLDFQSDHLHQEQGIIVWANRVELEMLGYDRAEYIGQPLMKFHVGRTKIEDIFGRLLNNQPIKGCEAQMRRKDGSICDVSIDAHALFKNGIFVHARLFTRDISEQKTTEGIAQATLDSLQFQRYALDRSAIVTITDRHGTIIYVNDKFCEISQYSATELLGKTHRVVNSGYHPQEFFRDLWAVISSGQVWSGEIKNRAKDGSYYWVTTTIVPFLDESGQPFQYLSIRFDITSRKQAEESVRQNELKFRAIFDNTFQLMGLLDPVGIVIEINRTALAAIAVTLDDVVGQTFWTTPWWTHYPDVQVQLQQSIGQAATGQLVRFEAPSVLADGTRFWVDFSLSPIFDDTGKVVMLIPEGRDITERKQLERDRERFLAIASELQLILGSNGYFQWVSPMFESKLGWTTEEMTSRQWIQFLHPDDIAPSVTEETSVFDGKELIAFENRYRHKDGSYRWFSWNAQPDPEKQVIYAVAVDITDRKAAAQKIQEQAALLNIATDAIIVRDLDSQIQFWNNSAESIYGWTAAEAIGIRAERLFCPDIPLEAVGAFNTVQQQGAWQGELRKLTKTGQEVIVESRWTLVRDEAGNPRSILSVDTDITEKKSLEQQFLRAQRLESLGSLASGIAHDLNNVLTPIVGAAQLLPMTLPNLDDRNQRLVNMLIKSSKRGSELVKQILTFARGMDGERTVLQSQHILSEIISVARHTFPKSISIHVNHASEDLWMVSVDATQLHQVLMNLVVNARDAMPNGGSLRVSSENIVIDADYVARHGQPPVGAYILMTITDTGIGMNSEMLEQIFDPFFTTKETGTGLGLSTVQGIIKNHGGSIKVESEVGRGTSFKIYLPAIYSKEAEASTTAEDLYDGKGQLVLVVDDESAIREIAQESLENSNYRVMLASDGIEAIDIYAQNYRSIALVLVDMMMPNLDTRSTIQALQQINPLTLIQKSGQISKMKKKGEKPQNEYKTTPTIHRRAKS